MPYVRQVVALGGAAASRGRDPTSENSTTNRAINRCPVLTVDLSIAILSPGPCPERVAAHRWSLVGRYTALRALRQGAARRSMSS